MFCTKCGSRNPDDAEFCCKCGKPIVVPQSEDSEKLGLRQEAALAAQVPPPEEPRDQKSWQAIAVELGVASTDQTQRENNLPPSPGFGWNSTVAFGSLFLVTGLFSWVIGVVTLADHVAMRGAVAVIQGLLFGITGWAILTRRAFASKLVWVVVVLSGLGVIARGLTILDLSIWFASLGLAIWYARRKPPASKQPPVPRGSAMEGMLVLFLLTLVGVPVIVWIGSFNPKTTDPFAKYRSSDSPPPATESTDPFAKYRRADSPPRDVAPKELPAPVSPCPAGVPAGVRVVPINDLAAIVGSEAKAWYDPKDHFVAYTLDEFAAHGDNALGYYKGQWYFSFKVTNKTEFDRPDLHFGGYCLAALQFEVEIQSDDGKLWKGTGKANLLLGDDHPLGPGWQEELSSLELSLGSRPQNGNLTSWRITKAWGFPLEGEGREQQQKKDQGYSPSQLMTPTVSASGSSLQRVLPDVMQGRLVVSVPPEYPPLARAARVQGTVVLDATISEKGAVEHLDLISGHPLLVPAAINAVRQWRYRPYPSHDKPVKVTTKITVAFWLSNS